MGGIHTRIRWRLLLVSVPLAIAMTLCGINLLSAWIFVEALIHPGCAPPGVPEHFPDPLEVQLSGGEGVSLRAWYYPSQNRAAIISLGGQGGSLGNRLPPVEPLLQAGYGVLQVDSRACADPPAAVTLGGKEVQEAAAGLAFLQSRAEVDPDRIGIFGFSMGGVGAIRTASQNPQIAAVAAEGGFYNLGADIVEPQADLPPFRRMFLYTVAGLFWLRSGVNPWSISPIDDLADIEPRPLLLIYGEAEAASGRAEIQYLAAAEPKELWIVPGGDHGSNHLPNPQAYADRILGFFNTALEAEQATE